MMYEIVFDSNHCRELLPIGSKESKIHPCRYYLTMFARDLDSAFNRAVDMLSVFPVRLVEVAESGKALTYNQGRK